MFAHLAPGWLKRHSGHRAVLAIALPIMAANVSEPLIGLVDTWVIGRLPEPYYIGAIALGAVIFSFVFWGFGFLRMGTGGLAAQAHGAKDDPEVRAVLVRALLISVAAGVLLVLVSPLIDYLSFELLKGSEEVETHARTYFQIRILSAPFALANYAFLGWFIGLGRARIAFMLQLLLNLSNIVFDVILVLGVGMAADGVALGTLIASIIAAAGGVWAAHRELQRRSGGWDLARILNREQLKRTYVVNFDIMVRSVAAVFVFVLFTAKSAEVSDVILAANTVLMNIMVFGTHLIDGFAHSAEALAGQAVGAKSRLRFRVYAVLSSQWALIVGVIFALLTWLLGPPLIDALTVNREIQETARTYLWWIIVAPVLGVGCYQLDGIFIGATQSRDLRNMMLISVLIFLVSWEYLTEAFGNHGLWASLMLFLVVRALTLLARVPALLRERFPTEP
ncbi:MAG: MATE family efflux transporter [Alphaproteobacteria bacterium]|nr:MATE family efflux transporter [Alphaproteobacteria bacterium]